MPINKPYPKILRHGPPNVLGPFFEDKKTEQGLNNLASYELLKNDLKQIFEFIEPCPQNNDTFSHRTFMLLLRACTEVESLCKQVFIANGKTADNIIRYSDLEGPMKLSSYEVKAYGFLNSDFSPFANFNLPMRADRSPTWYKAYNSVKHNRSDQFSKASLKNTIEAVGGVYVLLVAMYGLGFDHSLKYSYQSARMEDTPTFFRAKNYPSWSSEDSYEYNWTSLKTDPTPFQHHPITMIP